MFFLKKDEIYLIKIYRVWFVISVKYKCILIDGGCFFVFLKYKFWDY